MSEKNAILILELSIGVLLKKSKKKPFALFLEPLNPNMVAFKASVFYIKAWMNEFHTDE